MSAPTGNDAAGQRAGMGQRIGADRMMALVESGRARPLLAGYWPTPVQLDGVWWHNPLSADDHDYVRASAAQAQSYEVMAAQLRRAHQPAGPPAYRPRERGGRVDG